jgi:hypothetical protein
VTPPAPEQPISRTTMTQQDLTKAGQRKVNLIWEYTQMVIALMVVGSACAAGLHATFAGQNGEQIPTILSALVGVVVGSYFQRTNHMNIGGVGHKPTDDREYEGR